MDSRTPEAPPGYVFVSNHGTMGHDCKLQRPEDAAKWVHETIGVPLDEVVVLDTKPGEMASFAPERYAEDVARMNAGIRRLLDIWFQALDPSRRFKGNPDSLTP